MRSRTLGRFWRICDPQMQVSAPSALPDLKLCVGPGTAMLRVPLMPVAKNGIRGYTETMLASRRFRPRTGLMWGHDDKLSTAT